MAEKVDPRLRSRITSAGLFTSGTHFWKEGKRKTPPGHETCRSFVPGSAYSAPAGCDVTSILKWDGSPRTPDPVGATDR